MPANFSQEIAVELAANAKAIATRGKGILAADESTGTIGKRFANISLDNTEQSRAAYRELLFSTTGLGEHISGCILYEETLFQKAPKSGLSMVELLKKENIIPGIKVDQGLVTLPGTDDEKSTQGLDKLAERCAKYYAAGARFAKWRAVLSIDSQKGKPSMLSVKETSHSLARYAAICQANRLVPIVEPEILTDGAHTIEHCAHVTEIVLNEVFHALNEHNVMLEGALLKPNMVTAGSDCSVKDTPDKVAFYTVRTLMRTCPPALVGVNFLSGGQSEEDASLNLNAMNMMSASHPWVLSFSYGRALQASCIKAWGGKDVEAGKKALMARAKANGQAQLGKYEGGAGDSGAGESLYEKKYVY